MHRFEIRVYYEDTDLAGVVYYANYLRFTERARTEMLRAGGIDQVALRDAGTVFVVRRLTADYRSPARFDDLLTVETRVLALRGASVDLSQDVTRSGETLFSSTVTLAAMRLDGAPTRLPQALRDLFASGEPSDG